MRVCIKKHWIYNIIFIILLFIACVDSLTSIYWLKFLLKHIDEMLTLFFLCYVIFNYKVVLKIKSRLVLGFLLFMLMGTISTMVYRYQPITAALIDAFALVERFFVGYLATIIYTRKNRIIITDYLVRIAKIITVILFLLAIHDIFMSPFYPKSNYRYFMYSLQLMFPHATYLAGAEVTLLILLGYKNKKSNNIAYMLMATFVGVMTLRGKAIAFFAVYWLFYLMVFIFRNRNYFIMLIGGGIASFFVAKEQMEEYFGSGTKYSPRLILIKDGFKLMMNHFPIGTGFATFGSSVASTYYSPLYTKLGYSKYWGMSKDYSAFLTDCFWPTIMAQFGVIGLICFIFVICCLFSLAIYKSKSNKASGMAMIMTLIYMIITSLAESSFFNPISFLMFILFGLYEMER